MYVIIWKSAWDTIIFVFFINAINNFLRTK